MAARRADEIAALGRVALLFGGWSAEREVSLKSGAAVLAALERLGVKVTPVDPQRDNLHRLAEFDRAFVMLHGRGGEDGVIQGALEAMQVPYTGSGVLGSALAMDKLQTKLAWRGAGLPTPEFARLGGDWRPESVCGRLGTPLMVKPSREGSSIGMTKAEDPEQLRQAYAAAGRFDDQVFAERFVAGQEFTVAILGEQALPVIRLETPRGFYDFEAKYQANDTQYHCPCGLSTAEEAEMQALAVEAFKAVEGRGWGRVDIMRDGDGSNWLLEVNTVPGMTDHSLVPMAAAAAGISFDELVWRILTSSNEVRGS
ncbi:D-alanine--D-alanine ligase [Alkalilimnicola ehrlichii]|uniref:D-alanine--D-alanine ligase n=1 Tax=Alkalilimnicola ehrlichii TaxID=351052 RepID=A0A3E0WY14_9GAMM|nr:D-alanine--D-alanine ligase [Alkalilimnicola ehrlichii]RFA30325.1 D-alanine--D-alanine ligase [Alkalilimnicola ehrlichii]RFA37900.1 D-alanine--D-alanine ligase [Alkalilimnicola ehrlichii]